MPQPPTEVFRLHSRAFRKQVSVVQCLQCCGPGKKEPLEYAKAVIYQALSQNRKNLAINSFIPTCVSICLEQLGCHWTDFHEI